MNKIIALAVDLGGTNLRVAAVSEDGEILARENEPTCHEGISGEVVTDQIIRLLEKIKKQFSDKKIVGIGIGVPGDFDLKKGGISASNVSKYFIPIVEPIIQGFALPVHVLNDASMAALGEQKYGAGKGLKSFAYITISTGIGADMVMNGKLVHGNSKNIEKPGHQKIESDYSLSCSCGGINHWESYASGKNIPQFFEAWGNKIGLSEDSVKVANTPELFARVANNNQEALAFMEELGKINAVGISNAIKSQNLERIVLGGAVSRYHGEILIKYFTPYLDKSLKIPEIVISSLGDDNVLLGSASRVFEKEN